MGRSRASTGFAAAQPGTQSQLCCSPSGQHRAKPLHPPEPQRSHLESGNVGKAQTITAATLAGSQKRSPKISQHCGIITWAFQSAEAISLGDRCPGAQAGHFLLRTGEP